MVLFWKILSYNRIIAIKTKFQQLNIMKINTTAGLVGFLLVLSGASALKSDATNLNLDSEKPQSSIESRLSKISNSIKQKETEVFEGNQVDQKDPLLAYSFLNTAPSFFNSVHGWPNGGARGWINGGGFRNGGGGFYNHGGGSAFRNGGGFANSHGGGGFANRAGGGGFVNHGGGGGGFRNYR